MGADGSDNQKPVATWFYYDGDGQKQGPYSAEQLIEFARSGTITPGTMIKTLSGKSAVARKVKGLTFPHKPVLPPSVKIDFVAIDFETANAKRNSACAIGLVAIENGAIVKRFYSLIKPPQLDFNPYTVKKHGITAEMVVNEKTFAEIYPQIREIIQGKIVFAHNSKFDEKVLNDCVEHYSLESTDVHAFADSLDMARRFLPLLANHQLPTIAEFFGIEFQHHNALDDAEACAKIVLRLFWNSKMSFRELFELDENDAEHYSQDNQNEDDFEDNEDEEKCELVYAGSQPDPQNRFFEKNVVFTMFSKKDEEKYSEFIYQIGGVVKSGISKKVNFLIIADKHWEDLYDPQKATGKMKMAMKYREQGISIEIISEADFLASIETDILMSRCRF